jgi:hypothetical protein
MKILAKIAGFITGAIIGVVVAAILLELNRMSKGPIPGMAGLLLGAIFWKLIDKWMDSKK